MQGENGPTTKNSKNDLLETLPLEIRENLVWRIPANEPFSAFRDHVRTSANEVLYHRGKFKSVNNLEQDVETEGKLEDVVGAIMKKMGFQKKRRPTKGGAASVASARHRGRSRAGFSRWRPPPAGRRGC